MIGKEPATTISPFLSHHFFFFLRLLFLTGKSSVQRKKSGAFSADETLTIL